MNSEMSKALCWELASNNSAITGMRLLVAGTFVGVQTLSEDNARPRWKFVDCRTATEAAQHAVAQTTAFETDWGGTMVVDPGEIALHPSEVAAMAAGRPISPSLRARIFTSLQRRDPRIAVNAAPGGGVTSATAT